MSTSLSNTVGGTGGGGSSGHEQLSKTNLYIRGLTQSTTDKDLVSMCAQYVQLNLSPNSTLTAALLFRFGTIISTKAILDKNTNKCKGQYRLKPSHGTKEAYLMFDALQVMALWISSHRQQLRVL